MDDLETDWLDQNEMQTYMLLSKQAERTQGCRLKMLQNQRAKLLDEIHRDRHVWIRSII